MFNFEKLNTYQQARILVKKVYELIESFPQKEEFALKSQLRRAVVSIPSNIAEGMGRISDKEKIERLFNIWCTIVGLQYAKFLKYSEEMQNNGTKLCANLKNNFSCEAHNELLTNTLNLCYRNEIEKYKLLQDEILRYQNITL